MAPVQPGALVLVTGGNGFIAAHCIATLLRSGHSVRATVRSTEKAEATRQALEKASVQNLTCLELVVVEDPTDLQALSPTLEGCQAVLHLASAFNYDAVPGEFEEKLMIPAVKGTQVVCEAAQQHPSMRRVVIMSSFASVYDASLGLQPGRVYTEEDWAPLTYEDGVNASAVPIAYRASKVVAERTAWDYVRDHQVQYQLVTLCPGMVFGKMIHPISSLAQLNASNQIVWGVLSAGRDGEIPPTKAPVWIDVEDLAETSLKALTFPETKHERFLVTQGSYDTQEIADIIRGRFSEKHRAPLGEPGKRIADTHYSCDSSKAQRVLGVKFRGLEESIVPLAEQLYDMETR
ncbi:uncharacterized protein N7496_010770 [Penicillium cataractarum]|uniref:NAD-dependent epimerase/dehydratase domain-containing protein n=1 Tax=Penicillium cataractarum TaxID=2100454 RepID=A0A9W9RDQ1_9EURO|nr:uncharacterized protein N7496_010770 [Penicillium cataractarum]KAJ5358357.1 hypothetical protein N7496_010770 [Penicillium cataractarum]